jgi:uncharacterized protein (DUF4415 family)
MTSIDRASMPDDENPEWTDEMFAQARRPGDLPASLAQKLRGRPKADVTKERITIRLSRDVLEKWRATGPGWQSRMDEALRAAAPAGA